MDQCSIGLIGYGEVGRILAEDLRARGVDVSACDIKDAAPLRAHASRIGVRLVDSQGDLFHAETRRRGGSAPSAPPREMLLISAVTASQAVPVAVSCAPVLRPGTWFLDLNSSSPGAKVKAAELIEAAGGRYVEAAVMTAVPPHRIRVPLLLGGAHAEAAAPLLIQLGFAPKVASETLGVASATKMCRSVMIKGLEAMVVESFTAARAYGVEDAVLASLAETFPGIDWEKQGAYFFQRAIEHGRRRSEEMREVAATVREIGLTPWSAEGTAERQAWIADLADTGLFGDARSTDWRVEADRILKVKDK